jgi:hypothetical protein
MSADFEVRGVATDSTEPIALSIVVTDDESNASSTTRLTIDGDTALRLAAILVIAVETYGGGDAWKRLPETMRQVAARVMETQPEAGSRRYGSPWKGTPEEG